MKYYQNPANQMVYGYDETNELQTDLISQAISKNWVEVTDVFPVAPTNDQLIADCKAKAQGLLSETDWSEIPSVSDIAHTPHLVNTQDFIAYRVELRILAVNPVVNPTWPTPPIALWSK